jgi:hypothetical protein
MTQWNADLTAAEEEMLATFMQRLRATPTDVSSVPDAGVLCIKARLIRQWDSERRIRRPIDVMEPIELVATLAAAVLLLFWSMPSALDLLPRLGL